MTSGNNSRSIEGAWPRAAQFRRSIRFEFSIYVTLAVVALMAVTGYVMTNMYVKKTTEQVINEALVRIRSYSGPAGKLIISSHNPDALMLNNLLKKLSADYVDTYWAGIADKDGVLLAHTDLKEVLAGNRLALLPEGTESGLLKAGETFLTHSDTIYLSVPIMENDYRVGTFALASSTRRIRAAELESVVKVLTITIIMVLIGLPATLVVLHRKLRPVTVITDHLKNVSFDDISLNIPVRAKNEFGYLAETLAVMGSKLNQAQRDKIEKERITREYEIAREIQSSILPDRYPTGKSFAIFGAYSSAREVGGDYYDFIDFGSDKIGIIVADVSGKSLPGMLVMLLTRDIVKNLARPEVAPASLLTDVNTKLRQNIKKGMFVTMFYGVLNKKTGNLTFASAGHNPLIKLPAGQGDCQLLKTP
ncbi:MAG: SpoIIE family protein phosphatase, partial [Candidatus Zixiibacteriota bacterium]